MKSGFVGVLGQANVGKSTFINAIMGKKVTIVSEKIQTTRNRIRCIYNDKEAQIVFVDTPGLHKPMDRLGRYLLHQAYGALRGLDLLLYMIEPWVEVQEYDREIFKRLEGMGNPAILLVNKTDLAKGNEVPETLKNYGELCLFEEFVPLSCKRGINLGLVLQLVKEYLPQGPRYFSQDELTDRSERFLITELVREQVYRLTFQEIPYSVAVEVVEFRERGGIVEIFAHIYTTRESQKGIIIGRGGRMIREIGSRAREEMERLLGAHVFLDLRVKVRRGWVDQEAQIIRLVEGED